MSRRSRTSSGEAMKLREWLQIVVSTAERGLWWDSDEREYKPSGFGVALKFFAGDVFRPYTRPKYWFKPTPSKWNEFDPKYHGLIKFSFPILPFLTLALGPYGFYAGFKVFDAHGEKYRPMVGERNGPALTPSVTMRRTRWK